MLLCVINILLQGRWCRASSKVRCDDDPNVITTQSASFLPSVYFARLLNNLPVDKSRRHGVKFVFEWSDQILRVMLSQWGDDDVPNTIYTQKGTSLLARQQPRFSGNRWGCLSSKAASVIRCGRDDRLLRVSRCIWKMLFNIKFHDMRHCWWCLLSGCTLSRVCNVEDYRFGDGLYGKDVRHIFN